MTVAKSAGAEITEFTLLGGQVRLLQPKTGFRAGMDTVLLAAAISAKKGQSLLDIGCGVGSASLCVALRIKNISLTGIEIQRESSDLALQNAALNGTSDRCRFFQGSILSEKHIPDNAFDIAMMNPPFQSAEGSISPVRAKALAHELETSGTTLKDWIKYAHKKLKNGGTLTLIHRADRLDEIANLLVHRKWFGSLAVFPIWSYAGEDAKRVIVRARKERYTPLRLLPGIVMHKAGGAYTEAAQAVLSRGEALDLG